MKGLFVNCGNKECKKMLLKNAHLPPRTAFELKCFHCGVSQKVEAEVNKLRIIVIHKPEPVVDLTDDEDSDIVMLNV